MSEQETTRVKERLAALRGHAGRHVVQPSSPAPARQVLHFPDGREEVTPFGRTYVIERQATLDLTGPGQPLDLAALVAPGALACLSRDTRWDGIPLDRVLLLDTETTGLAGGTGTYVFLAGLGYFTTNASGATQFTIRQYLLRGLGEERAFLAGLAAFLDRFEALVTFNGKSFDWPLLTTRFLLGRANEVRRDWPHLDLLHPSRRIWRHRLASCSLGALEAAILGIQRDLDVPGALIPELYFRFLRDRDPRPLLPVLAHNERDITTLLALLVQLKQLTSPTREYESHGQLAGPDHFGLAGLLSALGQYTSSSAAYRRALEAQDLPAPLRRAALTALGSSLKRAGQWDGAVEIWRQLMRMEARRRVPDVTAYIELAKYQEHMQRDVAAALSTVDAALALSELRGVASGVELLLHRRARLAAKLARWDGQPVRPACFHGAVGRSRA